MAHFLKNCFFYRARSLKQILRQQINALLKKHSVWTAQVTGLL